jgi:hypothetical protein
MADGEELVEDGMRRMGTLGSMGRMEKEDRG